MTTAARIHTLFSLCGVRVGFWVECILCAREMENGVVALHNDSNNTNNNNNDNSTKNAVPRARCET